MGSGDPISIKIRRTLRRSTAKNTPISAGGMRNSRKRGTLARAASQKRLNRDGPSLSRFDARGALASSGFRLFDPMPRENRSAACSDRRVLDDYRDGLPAPADHQSAPVDDKIRSSSRLSLKTATLIGSVFPAIATLFVWT